VETPLNGDSLNPANTWDVIASDKIKQTDVDTLIRLYQLYDGHREALLWFLHEMKANSYGDYKQRYAGTSKERSYFTSVCGFFELSGALLRRGLIDRSLYFEIFNPSPYWHRARPIVEGMRKRRIHTYDNFEFISKKRMEWTRTRDSISATRKRS